MRTTRYFAAAFSAVLLFIAACSSHKVLMPPRVDLRALGTIGLLEFSSGHGSGLDAQATRDFLAALHSAQPGVPVLELGNRHRVLASVGHGVLDADAIRAIRERHHVDALIVGDLSAQHIKPGFRLGAGAESLSANADLEGALAVRIYETRSGATVWSSAVSACVPIASIDVADGDLFGIGATDPQAAEGRLAQSLVNQATRDFWPYWVRQ